MTPLEKSKSAVAGSPDTGFSNPLPTPPSSTSSIASLSVKSASATSSKSALSPTESKPPTTLPVPVLDISAAQHLSAPASPRLSLTKLSPDADESSLQGLEAGSTSVLDNLTATLETFSKYGILAPRKETRDSKVRVTRALELIQSLHNGEVETDNQVIKRKLASRDYEQLLVQIARNKALEGYFNHQLRYDYSHDESEFIVRIPSPLHEHVVEQLNRIITTQLDIFINQAGKRTAQLADSIYSVGSASIEAPSRFGGEHNTKSPDKSYGHEPCDGSPTLVIEVAWSQRSLDLPKLAKRYIQGSKGQIRTVIGVDIPYRRPGEEGTSAGFSIWRVEQNEEGLALVGQPDKKEFRNSERQAVPSTDIRLPLTDFVCQNCADSFADVRDEIVISSAQLCDAVSRGERLNAQMPRPSRPVATSTTRMSPVAKASKSISNAVSRITRSMTGPRRSARLCGRQPEEQPPT